MKVRTKIAGSVGVLCLALAGCGGSSESAEEGSDGMTPFTVGLASPESMDIVPARIALDEMAAKGYEFDIEYFESPETLGQAMQSGAIDWGVINAGTIFSSIDAGLEAKIFMGLSSTGYDMLATSDLTSCQDLQGKILAIEAIESTTGALVASWLQNSCPEVEPELTVVPGSENRIAGMLSGQIDASPIDYQNSLVLMEQAPGDYTTIEAFAEARELAAAFWATDAWLEANDAVVRDLVSTYVATVESIYADPSIVSAKAAEVIPDIDPELREQVIQVFVDTHQWIPVSGVQPEYVQRAIDFYGTIRDYTNITTADQVSTTEYVQDQPDI